MPRGAGSLPASRSPRLDREALLGTRLLLTSTRAIMGCYGNRQALRGKVCARAGWLGLLAQDRRGWQRGACGSDRGVMDFFGIGAMELLLILVLALVVVGPRRLPEVARKLAKMLRDMRRMWTEVSTDFARELNIEGAPEDLRTITDTVSALRQAGSPAKLLEEIVPKDVVATLESRPPSPAQLLAGDAPGAKPKPAPAGAIQAATGQAAPAAPAEATVQPQPVTAAAQTGSADLAQAGGQASEPAGAEASAPAITPESEDPHGA